MPITLPALGTISYNGVTIAGPRVHTRFSCRPQPDSANRTNLYNVYRLETDFVLSDDITGLGGGGGDAGMNSEMIMALLNQPGGPLEFSGLGYGGLSVNTTSQNVDVLYGPKSQAIAYRPVASNAVMQVHWTCEVAIAQCPSSYSFVGQQNRLLDYVWTQDFSINQTGLTTVTTHGHLAIALNRSSPGATSITYNADQQRDAFQFQVPLGFILVSQDYKISEDKSRMDFVGVCKEVAGQNAYPQFVSDIQVTQRSRAKRDRANGNFVIANCVISGSVEIVKPQANGWGWLVALMIMQERVQAIRDQGAACFLQDVDISESLFNSQRINFSISFYVNNMQDLNNMATKTGLFMPVQSTDWGDWQTTMNNSAWLSRGGAGLYMNPADDLIVDYCHPGSSQSSINYTPGQQQPPQYTYPLQNSLGDTTYKDWDHRIHVESGDNSTTHFPLPTTPPAESNGSLGALYYGNGSPGQPSIPAADTTLPVPQTQISGQNPVYVVSRGYALRANQPVELPSVIQQMTQQSGWTQIYSKIEPAAFQNYFGATLYGSIWYIVFQVNDPTTLATVLTGDVSGLLVATANDPTNKF